MGALVVKTQQARRPPGLLGFPWHCQVRHYLRIHLVTQGVLLAVGLPDGLLHLKEESGTVTGCQLKGKRNPIRCP